MDAEYDSISDDILKPKITMARAKANQIWTDYCDSNIPVVLNVIVQKLGIHAKAEDMTAEGMTRTESDGLCCILYKRNSPEVRQRFTVAHEIGHIVLEHTSMLDACDQYSRKSQEKEADTFAGELLVPSADLKKFVKSGARTVEDITSRYRVSKEVAFIAIQNNRLLTKIKVAR